MNEEDEEEERRILLSGAGVQMRNMAASPQLPVAPLNLPLAEANLSSGVESAAGGEDGGGGGGGPPEANCEIQEPLERRRRSKWWPCM